MSKSKRDAMIGIKHLHSSDTDFWSQLKAILAWGETAENTVADTVKDILLQVKTKGDEAVLAFSRQFDLVTAHTIEDLVIPISEAQTALTSISQQKRDALQAAADRIKCYHQHQMQESWTYTEPDGTLLGQQVTALDRVGLYVPGGKAAYPSSVLMNAIPAKVAGVDELVMVVPTPEGDMNEMVLAAAAIAGVDHIFAIGGAQAIAALAYGTDTVPQVDKIVGPGNIYVATAKTMVFGIVGIDMIAGPSEILVICDGNTNPEWIAMDLFSQAEHDENAQSILISPDKQFLKEVHKAADKLLPTMEREATIKTSLTARGAFIQVRDLDEAVMISNFIAPEHLELSVADPLAMAKKINHAGAIFMGRYTAEALGDYCAGPNHVLPTSRTARFSSPLGVYDFQKRSSLIYVSRHGAQHLGRVASVLSRGEGLTAHARSAEYRLED